MSSGSVFIVWLNLLPYLCSLLDLASDQGKVEVEID